jgi:hypothetical protein
MMEVPGLGKKGGSMGIPEGVELDKRLAGDCILMVGMLWFQAAAHQQRQRLQTRLSFLLFLAPPSYSCKI